MAGQPPLRLRLVKVRVGKTWMWLLTSVLDNNKLNVRQLQNIYKQRWGIEVEFRGLKQTMDKAELRCRNEARIRTEVHWSLMAMTIAELFALKVQLGERPAAEESVPARLWRARTDSYERKASKAARYRPPNPDKKPLGEPKIRLLTPRGKIKLNAINSTTNTA